MEARKSGTPCFLCQSLILSTTILNDIAIYILFSGWIKDGIYTR